MSKRPNVVPVIVEGPTEELALGLVFSQLFRAMGRLHFEVVHGDLLTQQRFCVTPGGNAESKRVDEWVRKGILDYLQGLSPKITWNDLACIIQITDTDAAFVPEELAPDHLVHRNEIKRGNARILARKSASHLKSAPCLTRSTISRRIWRTPYTASMAASSRPTRRNCSRAHFSSDMRETWRDSVPCWKSYSPARSSVILGSTSLRTATR